jgi:hypothetical protein
MSDRDRVFKDSLAGAGFEKIGPPGDQSGARLDAATRAALIRRGNELFNAGKLIEAKRVFVTTGYTDGLMRLGDHYYNRNEILEAFRMYWLAPDRRKTDYLVERMASVIRGWLKDEA